MYLVKTIVENFHCGNKPHDGTSEKDIQRRILPQALDKEEKSTNSGLSKG